jgi:3',5'-cyclic AMP phosphodiesterase CpdA
MVCGAIPVVPHVCSAQVGIADRAPAVSEDSLLSGPGPTFVVPAGKIPEHWNVIAYGDTRFTDPANITSTNPKVRRWLVDRIASEHPDALLISGDLPLKGSVSADYDVFKHETEPWRTAKLRVYPTLGNHELSGDKVVGLKNWWATFPELAGRRWYSVQFGNAYFIALDSDMDLIAGSQQRAWLTDQLAHLPKETQFVMLELHHPPVADMTAPQTHEVRPNEAALATFLEAQAAKLKAKIVVIGGHTHNYERFEEGEVVYLVSGGGGAAPYIVPRDAKDLYKNAPAVNYHYIKFEFDGKSLNATMYRVDGDADAPVWDAKDRFSVKAP